MIGIVDQKLVDQNNWVKQWAGEWDAAKIAALFDQNGLKAEVITADTLKNPEALKKYRAIMIPTDHCYVDEGSANGPIAKNIAAFVKAGGIYIMPMGAGHWKYKDLSSGELRTAYEAGQSDFLGFTWECPADYQTPGPDMVLTDAGRKYNMPAPRLNEPVATCTRKITRVGETYVADKAGKPCIYAANLEQGAVIHYSGGMPFDSAVRDWLIASYAAILKAGGPDVAAMQNKSTLEQAQAYDLMSVCHRADEIDLSGEWEFAQATSEMNIAPVGLEKLEWMKAPMPSSIQLALYKAGKAKDPQYGENWREMQWIAEKDWFLRKQFSIPEEWRGKHIRLRFDGMDYFGAVWLDGKFLAVHEGMFGGPTLDVSQALEPGKTHELLVRLNHETDRGKVMKAAAIDGSPVSLWGNKFRSIGLYQPVRLVASGPLYMEAPVVRTERLDKKSAELWAQVTIVNTSNGCEGILKARIVDLTTGEKVWSEKVAQAIPHGTSYWERTIHLADPKLWWPNGMGEQSLYRLELSLETKGASERGRRVRATQDTASAAQGETVQDSVQSRFGIRTLELRRNPYLPSKPRANSGGPDFYSGNLKFGPKGGSPDWGRWDLWSGDHPVEDDDLFNSDEMYRFLFVVNGRPFYAKGACWMTSDNLLSLTPERESWLIHAAKFSCLRIFRLNGGNCLFETDQFYNLCDENGILVWQDLPLHWSRGTEVPLPTWREQIKQSVLRIRQHPSLAVYVGGNEFAPYVEKLAPYLGIAQHVYSAYDNRPFRMSSPGGGTVHAYYTPQPSFENLYIGDPNWYGRYFDESVNFVSEWSYPALANMSMLKRVIPAEEMDQPGPVGSDIKAFQEKHPVIRDRFSEGDRCHPLVHANASYYGDLSQSSLPEYVEYTQMAHGLAFGTVFEQWRAQFPYRGGETVWTYNTHGAVSSWNMIDWFGQPLIAYYTTKRADEPRHVMANCGFFSWGAGDTFRASVFALNDAPKPLKGTRVKARILDREMHIVADENWKIDVPADGYKSESREIAWTIPSETPESYFFLELTMEGKSGKRLSRQMYYMKVLESLRDPDAREKLKAGAVAEPQTTTGPWLKPQMESLPTKLEAKVITCEKKGAKGNAAEGKITIRMENKGERPAWPVRLEIQPDTHSVLWDDNYFWLAPGESVEIGGLVRLDMKGLDPITNPPAIGMNDLKIVVSAWNAPALQLKPNQ